MKIAQHERLFRKKNIEDFGVIYETYYTKIYEYCFRHVSNRETAQDLAQDVFVKAFSAIDGYSDYGKILNYLYVIAKNLCTDHYRKKKTISFDDLDLYEGEDEMSKREDVLVVRNALRKLSDIEREIVILRFYQDLKIKDIATIMGMTLSTTKYHLKKGIQELERCLK